MGAAGFLVEVDWVGVETGVDVRYNVVVASGARASSTVYCRWTE